MTTKRDELACELVASIVCGFALWAVLMLVGSALPIGSAVIADVARNAGAVFGVVMFVFLRVMWSVK